MATFTNQTKHKLSWQAPVVDNVVTSQAVELLVGDTYKLDIGGFNLVITPENAPTSWATTTKKKNSWLAPPTTVTEYELNIGDGFNLNIGNGFTLSVSGGGRAGTSWNTTNKTR